MNYFIVDAFTDKPFGGNPAGVVLLDSDSFPKEDLMLKIAAELRYSETAFVRHDSVKEFTIHYFTPKAEVELCGHTKAGDLTIESDNKVLMQMAKPRIVATVENTEEFHSKFHSPNVKRFHYLCILINKAISNKPWNISK